jgi:hypothetical protein
VPKSVIKTPLKTIEKGTLIFAPATQVRTSAIVLSLLTGLDSSVGIATGYELDVPGIESRWERDFPQSFRPALGPIQPPVQR